MKINQDEDQKSKYHFYFVTEILKVMKLQNVCVGDCFGIAEDDLIVELYPYSVAIYEATLTCPRWLESDLFAFASEIAKVLWDDVKNKGGNDMEAELPSLSTFALKVEMALSKYR